jgi:hypothetical protein
MANKARGEAEIKLGGEAFTCVASLGALARIEGRLGKPLPLVLQDVTEGSYAACLCILEETCTNGREKIADLISGPVDLANAAAEVFQASGLLGGESSEKN